MTADYDMPWFGYCNNMYANFLLVLQFLFGFSVIDVSNLERPVTVYHYRNIDWKYFAFEDSLDFLYIVGQSVGEKEFCQSFLRIVNNENPCSLKACGKFEISGRASLYEGSIDYPYLSVTIRQGQPNNEALYTAIFDVSDPHAPELIKFVEAGGVTELYFPYLYSLDGTKVKIGDMNNPLFWIDSLILPCEGVMT